MPSTPIASSVAWSRGPISTPPCAMLLTSTRAIPDAEVDAFSDYDVVLVVRDIHPFVADRWWLQDFGEVLVAYWDPIQPDPDYGLARVGNVIQYADGLKIDFTLWPVALLERISRAPALPAELEAGYRVLADKDGLTAGLRAPTYTAYIPTMPDEATYQATINDFFTDAPYVAKFLRRDELLPTKWCLDYDMKHVYLRRMLEWRMECDHGWSVPVRALGKGLKRRLPADIWRELEGTYAGGGMGDNWAALFRTIALFGRVARGRRAAGVCLSRRAGSPGHGLCAAPAGCGTRGRRLRLMPEA